MLVIGEALSDEILARFGYLRLQREYYFTSIQDCLILQDSLLGFVMAKRLLPEEQLKKDYTNAPDVNLFNMKT
jgi:hypothetical protein